VSLIFGVVDVCVISLYGAGGGWAGNLPFLACWQECGEMDGILWVFCVRCDMILLLGRFL